MTRPKEAASYKATPQPGDFDPDDDWQPDQEEVRERLRAALRYLETSKPGKRMPALLAVYRACTGMEHLGDYRAAEAVRYYRCVRSITRAHVRSALGAAAANEPRHADAERFTDAIKRLEDAETGIKIRGAKPRRRKMGRPPKLTVVR